MVGVLLVTGGSRGIGAAICTLAARRGVKVAVNYNRSADHAMSVVSSISAQAGEAIAVQGDVTREADIVRMFTELDERLGRITALVSNAGGGGQPGQVEDVTAERLLNVINLNLVGPILFCRKAVRRMSIDNEAGPRRDTLDRSALRSPPPLRRSRSVQRSFL